jgi:hypothetical protein
LDMTGELLQYCGEVTTMTFSSESCWTQAADFILLAVGLR